MSPLGKYAEGVAALVALALVTVWLVMILLGAPGNDDLKDAVLIALGYVFGAKGAAVAEGVARAAVESQTKASAEAREDRQAAVTAAIEATRPTPEIVKPANGGK